MEAIHLPRILPPRSPRKSELLSDKIGRFNFKMEEREMSSKISTIKRRTRSFVPAVLAYLINVNL